MFVPCRTNSFKKIVSFYLAFECNARVFLWLRSSTYVWIGAVLDLGLWLGLVSVVLSFLSHVSMLVVLLRPSA